LQDDDHPDAGRSAEEKGRSGCLSEHAHQVGDQHDVASRETVAEGTAEKAQRDDGDPGAQDDDAEIGRRSGEVQDGECDRQGGQGVSERRGGMPEKVAAEVPDG
jgi:hypothetical protein